VTAAGSAAYAIVLATEYTETDWSSREFTLISYALSLRNRANLELVIPAMPLSVSPYDNVALSWSESSITWRFAQVTPTELSMKTDALWKREGSDKGTTLASVNRGRLNLKAVFLVVQEQEHKK